LILASSSDIEKLGLSADYADYAEIFPENMQLLYFNFRHLSALKALEALEALSLGCGSAAL
jgi:hypothetical protein